MQKLLEIAKRSTASQRYYNKFRAGLALIPLSADPDGVRTASGGTGRLLVGLGVAVMGFHLLAEIAESKTCSCDSLAPPLFYNQFYSQYHRTQRTSKWRIGAANKALHCIACHNNFLGQMPFCRQMYHAIKLHHLVTWCASNILTTLYFICVCRKLHCKSSAMYNFNLNILPSEPSRPDPTRPGHTCNFLTRPDATGGSGQQSCVQL